MIFGEKKIQSKHFVLFVLASIFLVFLADSTLAEESTVTRSLSTSTPNGNSIFNVTLQISNLQVGGIVEVLPDGFSYVSTTHPAAQVEQSGQNLVFSVIEETEISYLVRAPSSGSGTFTGKWDNSLAGSDGQISASSVTVKTKSSGGSGGSLAASSSIGTEQTKTSEGSSESKDLKNTQLAGSDSGQKNELETENSTSASNIKSKIESKSIPFISPAFFIFIFGAAAFIANGNKGARR